MRQRKISKADAESTYRDPDIQYPDDKGNPCYVRNLPNGKRVEVVIRANSDPPFVITVMD